MSGFSLEMRIACAVLGGLGFVASLQNLADTEEDILARQVAYTARSLDEVPESQRRTSHGYLGARAEGTTLILSIDKMPTANGVYDPSFTRVAYSAYVCDNRVLNTLLDDGATIRFEATTNTGRRLEPVEIEDCP